MIGCHLNKLDQTKCSFEGTSVRSYAYQVYECLKILKNN